MYELIHPANLIGVGAVTIVLSLFGVAFYFETSAADRKLKRAGKALRKKALTDLQKVNPKELLEQGITYKYLDQLIEMIWIADESIFPSSTLLTIIDDEEHYFSVPRTDFAQDFITWAKNHINVLATKPEVSNHNSIVYQEWQKTVITVNSQRNELIKSSNDYIKKILNQNNLSKLSKFKQNNSSKLSKFKQVTSQKEAV